jgi:aminomethyltransferase
MEEPVSQPSAQPAIDARNVPDASASAAVRFPGTPFAQRTAPLNGNALWMHWDRMLVVDSYTDPYEELRAIRERVAMGDMSPLSKYEVRGAGAERMLDALIPRDVTKLAVGQVYYTPWCNEDGKVVNDGLVVRVEPDRFLLSADPDWERLQRYAADWDVELTDVTEQIGILTLQGPKAPAVLAAASGEDWEDLPFSRVRRTTIAGAPVDVLRQGFTGEVGYELWVAAEHAPALWGAIAEHGAEHGIAPAGARALDVARTEAGLLIIGYDYTGANEDRHGAVVAVDPANTGTPYELGLGRLVDLGKGDFLGKAALEREASEGARRLLLGVECDWRALFAEHERIGVPPTDLGRVQWYPLPLLRDGAVAGRATSLTWGASVGKMIGFAHVDAGCSAGDEVVVRWNALGEDLDVPATLRELPFFSLRRAAKVA